MVSVKEVVVEERWRTVESVMRTLYFAFKSLRWSRGVRIRLELDINCPRGQLWCGGVEEWVHESCAHSYMGNNGAFYSILELKNILSNSIPGEIN